MVGWYVYRRNSYSIRNGRTAFDCRIIQDLTLFFHPRTSLENAGVFFCSHRSYVGRGVLLLSGDLGSQIRIEHSEIVCRTILKQLIFWSKQKQPLVDGSSCLTKDVTAVEPICPFALIHQMSRISSSESMVSGLIRICTHENEIMFRGI